MSAKQFCPFSGNKKPSYRLGSSHRELSVVLIVSLLFLGGSPAAASSPAQLFGTPTVATSVEATVCPPNIGFGETIQCSINSPGEVDTYTFTASPGDKVLLRMSLSSGSLWPGIRVYDSGGIKLCEAGSPTSAEIASCTLVGGGTYSILVFDDFNGTYTGDYYLYLQRLNNPGNAVPIKRGTVLDGAIVSPAQMGTYTFTVTASDKVVVRMSAVSGSLWPGIRVYSPNGTKLCEGGAPGTAEIASCALPGSGAYTILAFDSFNGTLTGGYRLYLDCCTIYLPLTKKTN
jgi:hypothetical protein